MNSWRLSSHFLPTAVRNLMPSNHSSSVSSASRAKACRCLMALVMIFLKRASFTSFIRAITASVSVSSVNCRMGFSCFSYGAGPSLDSKTVAESRHGVRVRLLLGQRATRRVALQPAAFQAGDERPATRQVIGREHAGADEHEPAGRIEGRGA